MKVKFQDLQGELRRVKPPILDDDQLGNKYGGGTLSEQEMLNQVLSCRRRLMPKRPYEGLVQVNGISLPANVKHGDEFELGLTITGSDHTEYSKNIGVRFWSIPNQQEATKRPTETVLDGPSVTERIKDFMPPELGGIPNFSR